MGKVLSNNSTLVASLCGLRVGEYLIFPVERASTVKVYCSFYGLLWRKRFRTKVNRYARTITVTLVSVADAAGTKNENSEKHIIPLKNESMNTTGTTGTNVTNGTEEILTANGRLRKFIEENNEYFNLLGAVYNAIMTTWLRNLEDMYGGNSWFVKCKGTDIITNELGDIIRESDGLIILHIDCGHELIAAYADEVIERGGTAERIYVSQ